MNNKEKVARYLWELLGIGGAGALCFCIYRWGAEHEKACFAITLGAIAYLLLCFYNAIFKNKYEGIGEKVISGLTVIAFSNKLYDYNKIIALFPIFKDIEPILFAFIILAGILLLLIITKIMAFIYENTSVSGTKYVVDNSIREEKYDVGGGIGDESEITKSRNNNAWMILFIFLLIFIGIGGVLLSILYNRGILEQSYDFFEVVSFLLKYASSIIMILLAIVIVIILLIEMIKLIISRMRVFIASLKDEEQENVVPLYLLSIIVDVVVCYLTYKFTGIEMDSFYNFVNDGKYLALPLTILFVGVAFVVFLRLIHATLVLLVDMKPENVKEYLQKVNGKVNITARVIEIIRIIIDIILNTILAALKFVSFIPDFCMTLYSFVLEDKNNLESDSKTQINSDSSNSSKNKERSSHLTGVAIIRVAAFSFSVVSWYATASGLKSYIFIDSSWQSGLISFGIQAILLVFNLKLPFYFKRISENSYKRKNVTNCSGSKNKSMKLVDKIMRLEYVIGAFYVMVLLVSSFFSFVYICNFVVYECQSGYADYNTILASTYREILNDTDDYIKEDTKAMQIIACELLGELKSMFPIEETDNNLVPLSELNDNLTEAEDLLTIAEEEKVGNNPYLLIHLYF